MSEPETVYDGDYWDDPVYHYLSRLHKEAETSGADADVQLLDHAMQELIDGSISEARYAELTVEARDARKQAKLERKQRQPSRRSLSQSRPDESASSVNVAELKKRIYNKNVSKENMIKAIEALPAAARREVIDGLSPGFRRKLGSYLTD